MREWLIIFDVFPCKTSPNISFLCHLTYHNTNINHKQYNKKKKPFVIYETEKENFCN